LQGGGPATDITSQFGATKRVDHRVRDGLPNAVALCRPAHDADTPYPLGLLRARRERPRDGRAAEKRNKFVPFDEEGHLITLAGRAYGR